MPYCFPRSSIKFQGHTVQNITNFDPNWAFPDYRPVAAFKSLRFALLHVSNVFFVPLGTTMCCMTSHDNNVSDKLDLKEMAAIHTDYTPTHDCHQNSELGTHFTNYNAFHHNSISILNFIPLEMHSWLRYLYKFFAHTVEIVRFRIPRYSI